MSKDRFDFSEIDAALPAAKKMQEEDRMTDALETNYKAVGVLNDKLEKLENRLSEALPGLDRAVSSLHEACKITVGEKSRRTLEQEGEKICRKIADRIDRESAKMLDRLSAKGQIVIPEVLFLCMVEVIIFLLSAMICFIAANARFIHSAILWEITDYITCAIVASIVLSVFACRRSKK